MSDESTEPEGELIEVGQTGRAHGVKGEVRVFAEHPDAEFFQPGQSLWLEKRRGYDSYTIEKWRIANDFVIAKFEEVDGRTEAERLRNLPVYVAADSLPRAGDESFYHFELEGRAVYLRPTDDAPDDQRRLVGEVAGIFPTGANDVLVVDLEDGEELYVPMFEGAVEEIAPDDDTVTLRPLSEWAAEDTDL